MAVRGARHRYFVIGGILLGAVVVSVLAAGTATLVQATNSTAFCASCHVYDEFYPEFEESSHHSNGLGLQAGCADCHLPHDNWWSMLTAKARSGIVDAWAYAVEGIDTPEAFQHVRRELAERVWERYRRNDSRFCRGCHDPRAWQVAAQSPKAQARHELAHEQGRTCIDCHKGVAHAIPEPEREAGTSGAGAAETAVRDAVLPDPGADGDRQGAANAGGAGSQGAQVYEACQRCHFAAAPTEPTWSAFATALEAHPPAGGVVIGLAEEASRTLHRYLRAQVSRAP